MPSYLSYKRQITVLDNGEDITWITVKGNHIPIKKGQNKEDAVKEFFESKKSGKKTDKDGAGENKVNSVEIVEPRKAKINYEGYRKEIKEILKIKKVNDWVANVHTNKKLNFKAIRGEWVLDVKNQIYKSPSWQRRQSSEYYVGIYKGKPVYVRKSNHWGLFFKGTGGDEYKTFVWELEGGQRRKDGKYANVSQTGIIEIPQELFSGKN